MKTLFKNCNVIDVEHGCNVLANTCVLVEDQKILSVGEEAPADRVLNLQGAYLMPGLINLHIHMFGTGQPSKVLGGGSLQKMLMQLLKKPIGAKIMDKMIAANVTTQLKSGVTTVRSVGDFCYSDIRIRDKIKYGEMVGPRMLVSGPAITVPGGHGDGTISVVSNDLHELEHFVDENVKHGVDLIKICVTGGVMDAKEAGHPGELKMSLEQTKAVCDRAHQHGMIVASHTESEEGLEVALKGGVDTIEHGAAINDEMAALYKERQAAMILTFSPTVGMAFLPPEITKMDDNATCNTKIVGRGMRDGAKRAMEENIPLGLGTDASCPLCTQYDTWRELDYFVKFCGVTPACAIQTATIENAKIAKLDQVTGSVTPGKAADLLIVKDNPLEDLTALRQPLYVMANGNLLEHPQPKKMAKVEAWLDSIPLDRVQFDL